MHDNCTTILPQRTCSASICSGFNAGVRGGSENVEAQSPKWPERSVSIEFTADNRNRHYVRERRYSPHVGIKWGKEEEVSFVEA